MCFWLLFFTSATHPVLQSRLFGDVCLSFSTKLQLISMDEPQLPPRDTTRPFMRMNSMACTPFGDWNGCESGSSGPVKWRHGKNTRKFRTGSPPNVGNYYEAGDNFVAVTLFPKINPTLPTKHDGKNPWNKNRADHYNQIRIVLRNLLSDSDNIFRKLNYEIGELDQHICSKWIKLFSFQIRFKAEGLKLQIYIYKCFIWSPFFFSCLFCRFIFIFKRSLFSSYWPFSLTLDFKYIGLNLTVFF